MDTKTKQKPYLSKLPCPIVNHYPDRTRRWYCYICGEQFRDPKTGRFLKQKSGKK